MTELESQEARVLAAARRGLAPSEAERARVRSAVASALAGSSGLDASSDELEPVSRAAWLKAAFGVGVAALVGAAGYATGHRVGFAAGVQEGSLKAPAVSSAVIAPTVEARKEEATVVVPPVPSASATNTLPLRRVEPSLSEPSRGEAPAGSEQSLDEELRTLRRVERAQRAGNPRLALALLDELDRDRPHGKLMEERAAARAVAECQSGFGAARSELAAKFRKQYGSSVYLTRVEAACTETDSSSSGDSPLERESPQ